MPPRRDPGRGMRGARRQKLLVSPHHIDVSRLRSPPRSGNRPGSRRDRCPPGARPARKRARRQPLMGCAPFRGWFLQRRDHTASVSWFVVVLQMHWAVSSRSSARSPGGSRSVWAYRLGSAPSIRCSTRSTRRSSRRTPARAAGRVAARDGRFGQPLRQPDGGRQAGGADAPA